MKLAWRHLPANHHYEVWRSASPYFDPDDPDAGAIKLEDVYPPAGGGTVTFVDTNPPPEAHYVLMRFLGVLVIASVNFDHQSLFNTCKVNNKASDGVLTAKFQSIASPVTQYSPEQLFSLG